MRDVLAGENPSQLCRHTPMSPERLECMSTQPSIYPQSLHVVYTAGDVIENVIIAHALSDRY